MQRATAIVRHEIRHVDNGGDRAQADRLEPRLQPFRTGTVLETANDAAGEHRAGTLEPGGEFQRRLDRRGESARHWRNRAAFQQAQVGGGKIARNSVDGGAIAAIGGERNIDHRLGKIERRGGRTADDGVGR